MIDTYGGYDYKLNFEELYDLVEDTNISLAAGGKEIIYDQVANHEGGISKEDLAQYVKEVADATGICCEEEDYP